MKPVHLPHPPQPTSPHNRSGCGVIYFLDSRLPVWEKVSIFADRINLLYWVRSHDREHQSVDSRRIAEQDPCMVGKHSDNVERRNHQKNCCNNEQGCSNPARQRADVDQDGCSVVPGR